MATKGAAVGPPATVPGRPSDRPNSLSTGSETAVRAAWLQDPALRLPSTGDDALPSSIPTRSQSRRRNLRISTAMFQTLLVLALVLAILAAAHHQRQLSLDSVVDPSSPEAPPPAVLSQAD